MKFWRAVSGTKKFWCGQNLSKSIAPSLKMVKTRKKSSKADGKSPSKVGRPIKQYGMKDVVRMVNYCAEQRLPKLPLWREKLKYIQRASHENCILVYAKFCTN